MPVRIPTLVLYLLGAAGTVSGSILSFFQLIGQGPLGGAVIAGLGVACMVAANVLHVLDPVSGALTPGQIRVMTAITFWLGVVISAANTIVANTSVATGAQTFARYFVAGAGVVQAILAATIHYTDSTRISVARRAALAQAQQHPGVG